MRRVVICASFQRCYSITFMLSALPFLQLIHSKLDFISTFNAIMFFFLNRAIFRFQVKIKDALHIFSFSFYAFNSILTYFICCFLMIYKCQCFFFSSNLHEKRFLSSCYMLSMQTFISISHDSKTTFK